MAYDASQTRRQVEDLSHSLRSSLGVMDVGNGTEVADALAIALIVDLRLSARPDGLERLHHLSAHEVLEAAGDLRRTLNRQGDGFHLPLGTRASPALPGSIRMGDESWGLDAGKPGLHPVRSLRHDAHGPNLELLVKRIRNMARNLACRRLGLPEPMTVIHDGPFHVLRFAPLAEAGQAILKLSAYETGSERFCSAMPSQIETFAARIVDEMKALWTFRRQIGARVTAVRKAASAVAPSIGAALVGVTVQCGVRKNPGTFLLVVEFLALDEAMRQGIVCRTVGPCHDMEDLDLVSLGTADRAGRRKALAVADADGWIDELAITIARAAPEGPAAVLQRLASAYQTILPVPSNSGPVFTTLGWHDGVVTTELCMDGLYWEGLNVELDDVVPEIVLACLPGRRLTDLVELPFGCDCIIASARCGPSGLLIQLQRREHYINCTTGRIWAAPHVD